MSHDLEPVYENHSLQLFNIVGYIKFSNINRFLSPENERRVNFTQITKSKIRMAMSFSFLHILAGKKRI